MTQAQKDDIESIKWFWPPARMATHQDELEFLAHSERGIKTSKHNPLIEGKRWRGITIHELYEPGILEGTMPYSVLLGAYGKHEIPPRSAVNFMKKEMFKGIDAEAIENCYQEICTQYS